MLLLLLLQLGCQLLRTLLTFSTAIAKAVMASAGTVHGLAAPALPAPVSKLLLLLLLLLKMALLLLLLQLVCQLLQQQCLIALLQ